MEIKWEDLLSWPTFAAIGWYLAFYLYGQHKYWKSRCKALEEIDNSSDGWENEAKFWRRHFDASATEWVEENVS